MSLKAMLKMLSSKNIKYLYVADFSIFLGFWLTFLSIIWLVYQLTQSSFSLGAMGLILNLPVFLLLPFAGVLADRVNRHLILIACSVGFLFTPMVLLWATWMHHVSIFLLVIAAPVYGAIYALLNPAVNAFIKDVVKRPEDVHRVTGLISSNTKIAQLFAAGVNGLIHLFSGISVAFLVAVIFHFVSIFALLRIRLKSVWIPAKTTNSLTQFIEGVKYTFSFTPFWSVLMMAATGSLIVLGWQWQLPIFASDLIGGGSRTLSLLFLCGGVGGILGGVFVSLRQQSAGLMRLAVLGSFIIALGLILFAFSRYLAISLVLVFFIDGGWVMLLATTSATLQLIVDADKRGRIMSFYAMGVFGLMPFSSFLIGALCSWLGISWGIALISLFCLLVTIFYWSGLKTYRGQLLSLYATRGLSEIERPI